MYQPLENTASPQKFPSKTGFRDAGKQILGEHRRGSNKGNLPPGVCAVGTGLPGFAVGTAEDARCWGQRRPFSAAEKLPPEEQGGWKHFQFSMREKVLVLFKHLGKCPRGTPTL